MRCRHHEAARLKDACALAWEELRSLQGLRASSVLDMERLATQLGEYMYGGEIEEAAGLSACEFILVTSIFGSILFFMAASRLPIEASESRCAGKGLLHSDHFAN